MKTNSTEDTPKSTQSKSNKKSTKSRSKSSKAEQNSTTKNAAGGSSISGNSNAFANNGNNTPTTPTNINSNNIFETANTSGSTDANNSSSKTHHKSYAGLEPRSIKIIWEQHDQSDLELSQEVCTRVAEDASYKLWELINSIKTYARHSGGVVTYDLVNEVLRDADVPPALGAMDTDWDRIDYDGSYYFYSDKIIELRDEYQKDVTITMPDGADFVCAWPVEDKNAELLKKYLPSLIYVAIYGDADAVDAALAEAAFSPVIGSCYRVILAKLIQLLAFKQIDEISKRCWRLLRALACNTYTRDVDCREEYYHLAEILICQLLAPYETIKVPSMHKMDEHELHEQAIKMEMDEVKLEQHMDMKVEYMDQHDTSATTHSTNETSAFQTPHNNTQEEKVYKLQLDDSEEEDVDVPPEVEEQLLLVTSPYFATPVDWQHVDELCDTIGQLAVMNAYFQNECTFHIRRRLVRFFEGHCPQTEREFNYVSRAVRGMTALGEYAFRELLPFLYHVKIDDIPTTLWNDFALCAVFLKGSDDIFFYEWIEFVSGADKLQPFMVYYAQYHDKLLTYRYLHRKVATFKINPKVCVRRLEWNTLAAAMCHGDDPNKALKPKPTLTEAFPHLVKPNLQLNRSGTIRFKFAGCRPVIIKPKGSAAKPDVNTSTGAVLSNTSNAQNILIARRKLFKPLTNERLVVPLSSYYFTRI